jgi:hypothetical protein
MMTSKPEAILAELIDDETASIGIHYRMTQEAKTIRALPATEKRIE